MKISVDIRKRFLYSWLMDIKNTPLTYEAFAALYRSTFATMMTYSPKQIGSGIYIEKLAALADAYPEWAEAVEEEAN